MKALLILFFVACGPTKRHEPVLAPPRAVLDATIEGHVVDTRTREGIAGATIMAESSGAAAEAAISDNDGRYAVRVAQGRHRVTAYYQDAVIDAGSIEVASHEVARLDVPIDHEAVEAAMKAAAPPACPSAAGPQASLADRERLALDVLARGVSAIPDGGLLPERGPIYVASDFVAQVHLSRAALGGSTRLVLRTMRELQAEADQTGKDVKFIQFAKLDIVGTCATVDVGVGIVTPSGSHKTPLCCCDAIDLYDLRNGHWTFRTSVSTTCA